jgi:hypothetical protein
MKGFPDTESAFSIVRGDPLFRLQRALRLVSDEHLFVARRAILFALLTWVPMAAVAFFFAGDSARHGSEAFLSHFGIHARCLIAIPLLIIAEVRADWMSGRIVSQFTSSGLVPESERARFDEVLQRTTRLRDAWWAWLAIAVLVAATAVFGITRSAVAHEMAWAARADGSLSPAAWWFFLVVRPLGTTLMLAWLWRLAITVILLRRVTGLKLDLIPAHPDRVAGLGFVEQTVVIFNPVVLAISATVCAHEAHFVLKHGVLVQSLKVQAIGLVVILLAIFLSPLFAVAPALRVFRRRAYFEYASLVGRVDAAFDRRWVQDRGAEAKDTLDRSDFSALADAQTVFETVASVRPLPISKANVMTVLISILVPMLCLVAVQVPVKQILARVAEAVM